MHLNILFKISGELDLLFVEKDSEQLWFLTSSFYYFWIIVWLKFLWEHRTWGPHHQCTILQLNVFKLIPAPPCDCVAVSSTITQDKDSELRFHSTLTWTALTASKPESQYWAARRKNFLLGQEKSLKTLWESSPVKNWTFSSKVHQYLNTWQKMITRDYRLNTCVKGFR